MAGRGKCQWIFDENSKKGENGSCNKDAVDGFMLCDVHLKEQKKIVEVSKRNSHLFATGDITDDGAPTVLEDKTKKTGNGPLDVLNGDPKKSYKFSRYDKISMFANNGKGYKLVRVETGDGDNRPVCGQDKDIRETYRDQVNEKGLIQLGDLVLMERPKSVTKQRRMEAQNLSKQRVDRILSGGDSKRMNKRSGLPEGIQFIGQRGEIKDDIVLPPPSTAKKSYQVPPNYDVK